MIYQYDNVGNRLVKQVNGSTAQTFTYDLDDRVTNSGYHYDANGNLLSDGTTAYQYDFENKLIASGTPNETGGIGTQTASYAYDADGLRVQQTTTTAGTTNYTIDPNDGYGNVVEEWDSNGNLLARYDYGDDLVRMDKSGGEYYYIYDGLGSTRQLSDSSGTVDDVANYDAFGNLLTNSSGSVANEFLFDGQQFDGTGLYYLRARYMDPIRGEFTSQDPFGAWTASQ